MSRRRFLFVLVLLILFLAGFAAVPGAVGSVAGRCTTTIATVTNTVISTIHDTTTVTVTSGTTTAPPPTTTAPPTTTVPPPPPPPNNCTKTLAAGGALQSFVSSLVAGDVGCLHGGTYTASVQIALNKSNVTLESYPGEMAVVGRGFQLGCGSCSGSTLRDFTIQNATNSNENGIDIDGASMRVEHMVIQRVAQHDIILHSDSSSAVVTRNFFTDAGLGPSTLSTNERHGIYVQGHDNQITDNVCVHPSGYCYHVYGSNYNETLAENTAVNSASRAGFIINVPSSNNIKLVNDISYGNVTGGFVLSACGTGCVFDHLLGSNNGGATCTGSLVGQATNCVTADPQFSDSRYHLASTSPAIDWSNSGYVFGPDLDGIARPQGAAADAGAYER